MDKSAVKEAMLSAISGELELWLDKESLIKDGYDYEEEFIKLTRRVNHILLSKSLGEVSPNRNKKKLHTCFGRLEVNKTHVMSHHTEKFGISAKLQELICFLAHNNVFEECENDLHKFFGIDISAKQIQRVSEHYGESLEEWETNYQEEACENQVLDVPVVSEANSGHVYVMVDGSMIYTREEQWKEMKVGRIYSENSRVCVQAKRTEVTDSLYVCTLGNKKDFFEKFEPYVEPYKHKVFIADGAKWIWNWVDDFYGDSVQILDFYHAAEKLGTYASLAYKDIEKRRQWLQEQKQRLKADEVENVLEDLIKTSEKITNTTDMSKALNDVIRYYQNNIERMKYESFVKKGYLIGSGAIESAHRSVIQQRLKMSGQRWSIQGAQRIANIRAYKKSNRWETVIDQIKMAA
jgi:hypothetical protein